MEDGFVARRAPCRWLSELPGGAVLALVVLATLLLPGCAGYCKKWGHSYEVGREGAVCLERACRSGYILGRDGSCTDERNFWKGASDRLLEENSRSAALQARQTQEGLKEAALPARWPGLVGLGPFRDGFAIIWFDASKWGRRGVSGLFVDRTGKVASPLFDDAHAFSAGLAGVKSAGKWGFIGHDGEYVIQPRYGDAGSFSDGLAPVEFKSEHATAWGYIDRSGAVVIEPRFRQAYDFHDGLARVSEMGSYKSGFIDTLGKLVIAAQFDGAFDFSDGLAVVQVEGTSPTGADKKLYGAIDRRGRYAIAPTFHLISSPGFVNGVAWAVLEPGGTRVLIDRAGTPHRRLKSVGSAAQDLLQRSDERSGKIGFADAMGNFAIEPRFDWAGNFSEGLAAVRLAGHYYYIDRTGNAAMELAPEPCDLQKQPADRSCAILVLSNQRASAAAN